MTRTKPNVDLARRYNQREAAEALGVERHTIRKYELGGWLPFYTHKVTGDKFTTGRDILHCWNNIYM